MSWNAAIYTLLISDATIALSVATDAISPKFLKKTGPTLVYKQLDNPKIDDDGQNWIRLRIWIESTDADQCETLRAAIDPIFNNGSGDVGSFTFANTKLIDKGATPIYNTDSQRYETFVDVRISYKDQ
jgi:hypothetical protein